MTGLSTDRRATAPVCADPAGVDFETPNRALRARRDPPASRASLSLDAAHGVRVRLTGPVALNDEQFATLKQGALRIDRPVDRPGPARCCSERCGRCGWSGRSWRRWLAGLVLTAGFAALAIGSLNLISVAFGVLFIGLGGRFRHPVQRPLPRRAIPPRQCRFAGGAARRPRGDRARPSCWPARATALGFLAFVPTRYTGIRELGWIAGFGMLIALALNLVLLPALLTLLRPPRRARVGRVPPGRADRPFAAGAAALVSPAPVCLPGLVSRCCPLSFDFDPLNLKDPKANW